MKDIVKGRVLVVGTVLLLMAAGCTSSSSEDAATSSSVPSVTATAGPEGVQVPGLQRVNAAFGEWVTVAEGVTMMLLAPWEFTPSEQAYAAHSPSWGPFGVEKYHHFVRTTLTIRNEPPGVAPGDPAHACETLIKEGKAKIVDLASGLVEREKKLDTEAGQQIAYDVGWGLIGAEGPDDVVKVETDCSPTPPGNPPAEGVVIRFGS